MKEDRAEGRKEAIRCFKYLTHFDNKMSEIFYFLIVLLLTL